jgi:signal transduction histidine kinase
VAERGQAGGGFSLFGAEERALGDAEILLGRLKEESGDLYDGVAALIESYRRVIREQRRLVRVSDRQQAQLASLNQELARRGAEAEEALARLRETQETLIQSEKLASLGALVAGVAHEINTPVGIAVSCASHLEDATGRLRALYEADDIAVEDFERYMATASDTSRLILDNCQRAATLINGFKQVAVDRTSAERRPFDLCVTLQDTLVSLGPTLRRAGHRVAFACPSEMAIDGYPGVLSQILTNFVMNTVNHAYDEGVAGRIAITVDRPAPGQVRLVYRDDGKGIAPAHRAHVFDPFFTTRRGGGGSGLGLHIVYNLATGPLGGTVALADDAADRGAGAAFVLTFPDRAPDPG